MFKFADAGINLFSHQFDSDRIECLQRAKEHAVEHLLLISSDLAETSLNSHFCQKHSSVVCTAGVHPHQAASVSSTWLTELKDLLALPEVVAIGECGLDFNREFSPKNKQIEVFEAQLHLAADTQLPVYLHERDAFETQLACLKKPPTLTGIAHCFTGSTNELRAYLDLGLFIGITGWLCDERRNQELVAALNYLPLERIIIETDSPYLLPRTLPTKPKNRRNEPAFLPEIARELARLKKLDLQEVAEQTTRNFLQLFSTRTC